MQATGRKQHGRKQENAGNRSRETLSEHVGERRPPCRPVYKNCTMYTNLSPCDMCLARLMYGIRRVCLAKMHTSWAPRTSFASAAWRW